MAYYSDENMDYLREIIICDSKELSTSQLLEVFHDILSERIEQDEEDKKN